MAPRIRIDDESRIKQCNVDSSAIARLGYDGDAQHLFVTFHSGREYVYFGVSPQRFTAFCAANSKGQYLNSQIKGRYAYKKM